jgi:SEC22 vesicle trafficking protein A/C
MKGVAGRLTEFKSKCILHNRGYTMAWVTDNGLGLVGLVDSRTESIELFAFLSHIADQFWTHYEPNKIVSAQRPFAFIDFDAIIERCRRKFNKKVFVIEPEMLEKIGGELKNFAPQKVEANQIKIELGKKHGKEILNNKFMGSR